MGKEVKNIIDFLGNENLVGSMHFVTKKNEIYAAFSIKLEDDVISHFRSNYKKYLEKKVELDEEEYGKSDDHDIVFVAKKKDIQIVDKIIATKNNKPASFDKRIDFTFIRFQNSNMQEIFVFKIYPPRKFLEKNKFKVLWYTDDVLKLSSKDEIVMETSIDCITNNEKVLVLNLPNFENMFDLKELYSKHSQEVFEYLSTKIDYKINNLDKLKRSCDGNIRHLRKMLIIKKLEVYSKLNINQIMEFNSNRNFGLTIKDNTVEIPNITKFFQLYNDDNLTSPLTRYNYISSKKIKIST